jgi:rod shape-determining protein MreC
MFRVKMGKKILIFIAVIGLLIFLHIFGVLKPVESVLASALNPAMSRIYFFSSRLRVLYNDQGSKADLLEKIKKLEGENNNLIVENSRLKSAEEENEILREYLVFKKDSGFSFVSANIISRQNINSGSSGGNIIINRGEGDGLKIGAPAISGEGIIIGKIIALKDKTAEICLITAKDCQLASAMQNKNGTSGIVRGEFGLTVRMEFIPQTEEIKIGDTVITSGLEENIPRGLIVGRVSEVKKENNELWQSAVIEPLVDLDNLIIVSVLLP